MIRLVSVVRRKEGTTHEQFLEYWRETHGPLIRNSSAAKYVRRYEQHPVAWPPEGSTLPEPEWDGVTIQWFDSTEAFYAHMREDDFPAMIEDTMKFLDMSKTVWTLTEEPTIVIDGK